MEKSHADSPVPDTVPILPNRSPAELLRFVRFAAVGASGVFVNVGVVWFTEQVLLAGFPQPQVPLLGQVNAVSLTALVAGIVVSILTNFLVNDRWTWGDRDKSAPWLVRCGEFYLTNGLAAGLQLVIAWALVNFRVFDFSVVGFDLFPWATTLASLCAIGIATPLNFVVNNLWTFRER